MAGSAPTTLEARRELTVRAHIEAENQHDVASTVATFARPQYNVVPFGAVTDGQEAVTDLLSSLFVGFPDFHVELETLHHAARAVIVEVRLMGTHLGPWAGLDPTRRTIDVPACAIFDFEGDSLLCERVYFDFATMLRQLGAMA